MKMKKVEKTPYEKLNTFFMDIVDKDYTVGMRRDEEDVLMIVVTDSTKKIVQALRFDITELSVVDIIDGMETLFKEVAFKVSRKSKKDTQA